LPSKYCEGLASPALHKLYKNYGAGGSGYGVQYPLASGAEPSGQVVVVGGEGSS
jgi:hypothetical protein